MPGVNNLQTFGRWAFAELTDVYQMECAAGASVATSSNIWKWLMRLRLTVILLNIPANR